MSVVLWLATAAAASDGLFVGNSYTQIRDLDVLARAALRELGDDGRTTRLTAEGLRWVDHVQRARTPGTPWEEALVLAPAPVDWGVLQEQSQILGFDADSPDRVDSLDAATTLDGWLRAQGAATVLLLTWGRRDGDATLPAIYPDFLTMQGRLVDGTVATRDALATPDRPVWLAPAGLAYQAVYEDDPDPGAPGSAFAALYQPDGSHPSVAGTWLAACVVATTLTGGDPAALSPPAGLDPALAATLAGACGEVVLGGRDGGLGLTYPWTPAGAATDSADPVEPPSANDDAPGADVEPDRGCGCGAAAPPAGWLGLAATVGALRRRRQARRRTTPCDSARR